MTYTTAQQQTVFNHVTTTLKAQGFKRAMGRVKDQTGVCMLRTPHGKVCSIGSLLDQKHYSKSLEDLDIPTLVCTYTGMFLLQFTPTCQDLRFLVYIKDAHDDGKTPKQMKGNLSKVAQEFNLTEST